MALDFPSSPTNGQVYTDSTTGNRYVYNTASGRWNYSANDINMSVATTPLRPANPQQGDLWWNSDYGRLFVYYTDEDGTNQWVDANPVADFSSLYNSLLKTATLDFGDRPVYSNSFNITDSTVTTNSRIVVTASSDNFGVSGVFAGDEMEMDQFFVTANVVTNGFITFAVVSPRYTGPIKGKRNILYTVSY